MNTLSIKFRSVMMSFFATLIIVLITFYAYFNIKKLNQNVSNLANLSYAKNQASNETMSAIQNVVRSVFLIIAVNDMEFRVKQQEYIKSERVKYKASLERLRSLEKTERGNKLIDNMLAALKPLVEADNKALKLALEGDDKAAGHVLA